MQCILIFDHLNDVIYFKQDAKFYYYIRKRCIKERLLQEEDAFSRPGTLEYNNALVQLFSPMVASQRIMVNQFNSPYTGITCQDGTTFVFTEYLNYILVAIGKEIYENDECYLKNKLKIFLRLVTFLCGPTLDILRISSRDFLEKRELLEKLIDSWDFLYRNDLTFRLEAQEKILTNSVLNGNWIKLLQNVLEKLRNGASEATACHAFILIKTKVLATYSRNAGTLSDGDILLLILLSVSLNNETFSRDDSVFRQESYNSSDSEQYFSPCASPAVFRNSTTDLSFTSGEISREIFNLKVEKGAEASSIHESDIESDFADGFVDISTDFKSTLVFLQSTLSTLVPYVVNYVNISEGIVLATISAVNRHVLSSSLVSGIETLYHLQNTFTSSLPKSTVELLDSNMRNIVEGLKKQKTDDEIDIFVKRIQNCWDVTKKSGFMEFLKNKDHNGIPIKLERCITQLSNYLKICFQKYCVGWYRKDMNVNGSLIDAQALVRYSLADYVEYLKVKGEQNISMANYYADFAGMVHFIFVDRSSNQVILPSMDTPDKGSYNFISKNSISIYKKLCYMVDKTWTHLLKGHTTVIWRDDCYHYSYFLWFEDSTGNPCKPLVPCVSVEGIMQPRVICANYYKQLVETCFPSQENVRCYELYCLHLATVPTVVVNNHARRLTAKIWELVGSAQTPIDLVL